MLQIIDYLFFVPMAIFTAYVAIFAVASLFASRMPNFMGWPRSAERVAVFVPSYAEDAVVEQCVRSCLENHYPSNMRDVYVISDHQLPATDDILRKMGATVFVADYEGSTKAKALNFAMQRIEKQHDIALVVDADNILEPYFLCKVAARFDRGACVVQAQRVGDTASSSMAVLDAASECINNSIFRSGHNALGLSAALIGSGMAFEYPRFREVMSNVLAVGGFDKELEHKYLADRVFITYAPEATLVDQKVATRQDFSGQRRRWLSAQLHYLGAYAPQFLGAIWHGNLDFADKIFQMAMPPRVLMLGFLGVVAFVLSLAAPMAAIKWWVLLAVLVASLALALGRRLWEAKLWSALLTLPWVMINMALTLLRIRGANKTFIHTKHS